MKIWFEFGSEHSMDLIMVGIFETEEDAVAAEQLLDRIKQQVYADMDAGRMEVGDRREQLSDELRELIREAEFMIAPAELDDFGYDFGVEREGNRLVLRTEEIDVFAFVKVMLKYGAKVEILSGHHHPYPAA